MRATVQTSALVLWAAAMIIGASGCKEAEVIDERVNVKLELGACLGGEASADGGVAGVESTCKPTLDTLVGDGAINACLVFQHVGEGGQTFRQGLHWANGDIAVVPGSAPIVILPGQRFTADIFLLSEGGATAAHCDAWSADAECGAGCVLKYHQAEEAVQANGTRLDFQSNGTCEPIWGPIEFPREACDGLDNDCNGQIDEGLQCGDNCLTDADCADNAGLPMCVGGTCKACDPNASADAGHETHAGCGLNELCCAPGGGEPACVATDPAAQCAGCGIACDGAAADTCTDRACVCGAGDAACGDDTPLCVGATCVQCDAEANAPTGDEGDNRTDANAACGDGQLCCNNTCVDEDPSADCGVCGDGCSLSNNRCEQGVCRCGVTADCEGTCTGGEADARQAICNECTADGDCREADRPLCIDASVCRACEFGSQDMARNCAENGPAPICNPEGGCTGCQTHVQCAARPGRLDYCLPAEGACRECNPENADGCNEFNPICSADGFCMPCERDEQCPGGVQTCVRGQCVGCDPGTHRGCGMPATRPVCDGITRICRSCGSNDECEAASGGDRGICIPGTGTCEICNIETQEGCGLDSLCCADGEGVPRCVPTTFDGGCEACGQACDGDYASVCSDRQCECEPSGRGCTPDDGDVRGERCDDTAPDLLGCVECRDNEDCPLSAQCCGGVCTGTGGGPGDICIGCGVGGDSCDQGIADTCSNRVCVCGVDGACEGNTPVCDHVGGGCVQCLLDGDCLANGLGQQCVNNECVQCDEDARDGQLAHIGCEEASAEPICDDGNCRACLTDGGDNLLGDADCLLRPGDRDQCVGGECAACAPGVLVEANPLNDGCAPGAPICDGQTRTCRRCQGDNECPGTLLCVGGQCNRCNPENSADTCGGTLPVCDDGNLRCRACDNDGDCGRAGLPGLCTDDGRCVECDLGDHRGCQRAELCCGALGAQACVAATMAQCGACGVACDADSTNRCDDRVCECGNSNPSICAGVEPYCVGAGNAGECIACRNDGECVLPGRDECVATNNNLEAFCEVCDPADNAGCNLRSNQPFCKRAGAVVTCSSCDGDAECAGHPVGTQCVASGACKTCDPSDDHGCVPGSNLPICSDAFVCTGCRADVECASNARAGDLCHNATGSCFACDDQARNGDETDVDCGGRCARDFDLLCDDALRCAVPTDCVSGVCTAGRCAAPACDDGLRNGDETDVDCGGICGDTCETAEVCAIPGDCVSLNCVGGRCAAPVCDDGIRNQDETGIDCGGARCGPCADGLGCQANADCVSTVCTGGTCAVPTCNDNHRNGAETDVDCGGPTCDACANTDACLADRDCASLVCRNQQCVAPTCADATQNQDETGIDCGGACRALNQLCPANAGCVVPGDCSSGTCEGGVCSNESCENDTFDAAAGETDFNCGGPCGATCVPNQRCLAPSDCTTSVCTNNICQVATCVDMAQNADETDVDCGGGGANNCDRCVPSDTCVDGPRDCTSFICAGGVCTVPTCDDGVKNQNETDVDCAGVCATLCAPGRDCNANGDCAEGVCTGGTCAAPTCNDNTQNQDETDVDCGDNSCDRCLVGDSCINGGDCVEAVCIDAICAVPTCFDTKRNQDETDTDCGGDICDPCVVGDACIGANDCDSGVCAGQVCQAPACDDGVNNGDETGIDCGGPGCPDCAAGQACVANQDCISQVCTGQICQAPTCVDQVQNGTETDLDCGGAACRADGALCVPGQDCGDASDCDSGVCTNGTCAAPACDDGVLNGGETGPDCGGTCFPLACADGLGCAIEKDCQSLVCTNNLCQVPRCNDGVLNGDETDIDCGGNTCSGCRRGEECDVNGDCAVGAPHCVDGLCQVCDLGDHTTCAGGRLCCVEPGGTPTCQRTGTPNPLNQCQSCDEPCNLDRANVCTNRVCMCGDQPECADSYCLGGACGAECLADEHCAASANGTLCDGGAGTCGCGDDGDCLNGATCDMNGVCVL
jgi:hypothetical protein